MYEYVHILDKNQSKWVPSEHSEIENYELTTAFPKKKLDPSKTLAESNCTPSATVFVREDCD